MEGRTWGCWVNCSAGAQVSRLQNQLTGVSAYLTGDFFKLPEELLRFTATLVWLQTISPGLTAGALLPLTLLLPYALLTGRVIGRETRKSRTALEGMNTFAGVLPALFPVVRLYDAGSLLQEGYRLALDRWQGAALRSERVSALLMTLSGLLSALAPALLFLVGGSFVTRGLLSAGTLYIFLNLSGNISGPMRNLPGHIGSYKRFTAEHSGMEGRSRWDREA
ncbi:MAG: ABC transporter transmembrane domain-containing protein [Oscillospiraceae bacterium]|nr:ABC transporter transmembrane domain-containing protein [Oscillospiraceae bacterium]